MGTKQCGHTVTALREPEAGFLGHMWTIDVVPILIMTPTRRINCVSLRTLLIVSGEPLLTTAEIAGIVVGGVVFIVLLILLIYFCTCHVSRYRKKKRAVASYDVNSRLVYDISLSY